MKIFKKLHWLSLIIGALSIILPIVFWNKIPNQIPMHYNAAGVVDNWSDKSTLILLFFVIALIMGMMSIVVYFVKSNMISKYSKEYEKTEMSIVYPMLILTNLAVQCMFAYMVFCAVTCRNLGNLFLPIALIGVFTPMVWMVVGCIRGRKNSEMPQQVYKCIEQQEQGTLYRSAVDWWLGLLLGGCAVFMVYLAVEPIVRTGKIEWTSMVPSIITLSILLPLSYIKYIMFSEHMLISCSVYGKVRVAYKDIVDVKETMNPLSSAALSIHRIQIDYVENGVYRMVLISPVKKKMFLEQLENYRNEE